MLFGESGKAKPDGSTDGVRQAGLNSRDSIHIKSWVSKPELRERGSGMAEGTGELDGFRVLSGMGDSPAAGSGEGIPGMR